MATLSALTDDVFNMLYGIAQVERPTEDTQVTATFSASAVEIDMLVPNLWRRGDFAEADDGDIIIFDEDHPASGTATVRRAQRGSTATEHLTATAVWQKNPTYLRGQVERFIQEVVRNDLYPDVWTFYNGEINFAAGTTTYDLPEYIEDVIVLYQHDLSSDGRYWALPRTAWDVERKVAAAVSTNSNLLRLRKVFDEDVTTHYIGKRRPHVDDLANMSEEVAQLIPWAVIGKMMAGVRAAPRRFDPPRRDRDSTEGGEFRDYRGFMSEFLRQKNSLKKQLQTEVPSDRIYRPRRRRRSW